MKMNRAFSEKGNETNNYLQKWGIITDSEKYSGIIISLTIEEWSMMISNNKQILKLIRKMMKELNIDKN